MSTRTAILDLLHRDQLTVAQLVEALGVTRNAIIVQLRLLLAEGLVRRSDKQTSGGVGKPAARFEAVRQRGRIVERAPERVDIARHELVRQASGRDLL